MEKRRIGFVSQKKEAQDSYLELKQRQMEIEENARQRQMELKQ